MTLKRKRFFPIFHVYNVSEWLSLWAGDAEDYMYAINSEMCLADDFNGPDIQQDVIQRDKEMQDTSSLWIIVLLLGSKLKTHSNGIPLSG